MGLLFFSYSVLTTEIGSLNSMVLNPIYRLMTPKHMSDFCTSISYHLCNIFHLDIHQALQNLTWTGLLIPPPHTYTHTCSSPGLHYFSKCHHHLPSYSGQRSSLIFLFLSHSNPIYLPVLLPNFCIKCRLLHFLPFTSRHPGLRHHRLLPGLYHRLLPGLPQ